MNSVSKIVLSILSLTTLVSASAFASEINCTVNYGGYDTPNDKNYSALLVDVIRGTCENGAYEFELSGMGLGLRIAAGTALGFACPFSDKIAGTYGGIKADVSVIVGLDAGLFLGTHGLCALGGVNGFSIGVSLDGSRLKVIDRRQARNGSTTESAAVALLDDNSTKITPSAAAPVASENATSSSEGTGQRQI